MAARRIALLLVCLIGAALVPAASGAVAEPPSCPPAADVSAGVAGIGAPPGQVVACVAARPVTGATFDHWARIAERAEGRRKPSRQVLVKEVMGLLIASDWILEEAKAQGVSISAAQVRRRYESIRRQQFPRRREFEHFLRSSGETVGDLLFRVRVNMTSSALQAKVVASAHTQQEREKALEQFIVGYKARWKPQTYCATAYAVADCGHVEQL